MPNTTNEAAERVYVLVGELAAVKKDKKDSAAGFSEEIKRIEKEIKEVMAKAETGETVAEEK